VAKISLLQLGGSIGPVLGYFTYLGGSGTDVGRGVAVDGSGNAYVTGDTSTPDSTMHLETKFLRLRELAALGDDINGWRVCWLGGWGSSSNIAFRRWVMGILLVTKIVPFSPSLNSPLHPCRFLEREASAAYKAASFISG
jgi:hypothetical protein